ncbi:MAG: hypothetical protein QG622_1725 [Actinomycetota bacterium]|nr:hypothetical protein [Actinomycetota bacterium]
MLRSVRGTRYVTPLREGGSLPGIVEADDDGTYVVKFRGAGQGSAALDAELASLLSTGVLGTVLDLVPGSWLLGMNAARDYAGDADAWRARYLDYLVLRLAGPRTWWSEAIA